ncbi:P-loop containing nucleoside triphosphate hydrolase protein [Mycena sanguinolenta]|nr:P-loop containing nucleoside triphosphate hydrolase protein [Mycena sanguinolenta]
MPYLTVPPAPAVVNNCPHPSRVFHGRQSILDKMQKYFSQDQRNQYIFLLYGVGGAGKTQIALEFIQSSSWFWDRFYIDASTQNTINAGLQNIALMKGANTSEDALTWLQEKHEQWLLLFDNADDPDIDLNPFLPRCDHGNIIITSRNPALRLYAGSNAHVSDMEEADAAKLLLARAGQEATPHNEEMAGKIAQELSYLPLAIIQAGAFIAESGALHTYLELYRQNKQQLLKRKPAQSHTEYSRTVHTTWQISFDRLSEPAQTFLQLCSFLHHQGISEKIFSQASKYQFSPDGPSKETLQKPMELLSQYLGSRGVWDSLQFTEVTNQLRAYSLIEFNTATGLFSIHPLVHSWSGSTLTDPEIYHFSMVAIVGMAITEISMVTEVQLVQQLVPHIDALRKGQIQVTPDFNEQYALIYLAAGIYNKAAELGDFLVDHLRNSVGEDHLHTLNSMGVLATTYLHMGEAERAKELTLVLLKKRQDILGEDHPDTLLAMGKLARIYSQIGQFQQAQELEAVVLEKRRNILGEDHPQTLMAMGNLASIYQRSGQLNKAEELGAEVLRKQQAILGENHPYTLLAMENLAIISGQMGQFKRAQELIDGVLKKRQVARIHRDTVRETVE